MPHYLSCFSGIGGLDLGLDRAGWTCAGQIEIEPYCRTVLDAHWPEVPKHDDITTAVEWWRQEQRPAVDLVCGGPPCQPFSRAGVGRGMADGRWLWPDMHRLVSEVRPRFVLLENVPHLLEHRDAFGDILADLATLGFDAQWAVLSACAVGASHSRERLFLVAYPPSDHGERQVYLPAPAKARGGSRTESGRSWSDWWLSEPALGRVAHGLPKRVVGPALRAVGNSVVPAVVEQIGRLILA